MRATARPRACSSAFTTSSSHSFEPARSFAGPLDYQHQLDGWFADRANARTHRTLRAVPAERLAAERELMLALPDQMPDLDRRFVIRVPAQPYLRWDTNDYSLDPRLAGRRVEVRISQAEVGAVALDSGEPAASHRRASSPSTSPSPTPPTSGHSKSCVASAGKNAEEPEVDARPCLTHHVGLIPA